MSPLARPYTTDGSLSYRSRSGYVSVLKPGTVFVALFCTRSIASGVFQTCRMFVQCIPGGGGFGHIVLCDG